MRVLDVRPRGVIVSAEFDLEKLKLLRIALDNAEIKVSKEDKDSWEARNYVVDELYPEIVKVIEEFKDAT